MFRDRGSDELDDELDAILGPGLQTDFFKRAFRRLEEERQEIERCLDVLVQAQQGPPPGATIH